MTNIKVIVASKNPVKINSTRLGFEKMFKDINLDISGISVPSNVSDQPLTEEETLLGATNRAKNAKEHSPNADFWVDIEGGLKEVEDVMEAFAWVVILSKDNKLGKGRTGSFSLPPKIVDLIKQGIELGEADDIVFKRSNSKQENGAIGILTDDVITRTTYYEPAVIFALIPFKNIELY